MNLKQCFRVSVRTMLLLVTVSAVAVWFWLGCPQWTAQDFLKDPNEFRLRGLVWGEPPEIITSANLASVYQLKNIGRNQADFCVATIPSMMDMVKGERRYTFKVPAGYGTTELYELIASRGTVKLAISKTMMSLMGHLDSDAATLFGQLESTKTILDSSTSEQVIYPNADSMAQLQ